MLFRVSVIVVLSSRCNLYITSRTTRTLMLVITVALLFFYLWFQLCEAVVLLKTYNSRHTFDIICLLESYFDSNILPGDRILRVSGYNSLRSLHLSNGKMEVFVYITRVIRL